MMRRQMKLAAVLVVVVLALTGFSTAGKSRGGKSGSGSSSGGGCSSSKKSNNGYRHTDYSDDDYDSDDSSSSGSSGSYGTPTPTASDAPAVRVIRCAAPRKGKRKAVTSSMVELRAEEPGSQEYEIDVRFLDGSGRTVDTAETTTIVDGGDVRTLTVRMESPGKVSRVKRCEVTAVAL